LPADLCQQLGRVGLVEQDRARRPAIGKASRFSSSSRPGVVAVGKPMMVSTRRCAVAEARLQPAGQRLIGQQRVEIHRGFGHADALAPVETQLCR
jgi:hypothetical protein